MHPLVVVLKVGPTESPLIGVKFLYYPVLQVVAAAATDPADVAVLASMYPGDDGLMLPTEAAVLLAGGDAAWDPSRPDRPFRQHSFPAPLLFPGQALPRQQSFSLMHGGLLV